MPPAKKQKIERQPGAQLNEQPAARLAGALRKPALPLRHHHHHRSAPSRDPYDGPYSAASDKEEDMGLQPEAPELAPPVGAARARTRGAAQKRAPVVTAGPARDKKPRKQPVAGPVRALPCLGCMNSVARGRFKDGACRNAVGISRCLKCARSSHKCEEVPALARGAAAGLMAAYQSGADKKEIGDARQRWHWLLEESRKPSSSNTTGDGSEMGQEEEEKDDDDDAPQGLSGSPEIPETVTSSPDARGVAPMRSGSPELGEVPEPTSTPRLAGNTDNSAAQRRRAFLLASMVFAHEVAGLLFPDAPPAGQ